MPSDEQAADFTHVLRVRYAECDAQGIVFNGHWFFYFDAVMTEFWRDRIGGYADFAERHSIETVVAETGARFRGAARFDELIEFAVIIARVGNSSLRAELAAFRDGQLLVEGFLEYVFVDALAMQPVTIPDEVRTALDQQARS